MGPRSRTIQRRQTNVVPGAKRKPRLLCCAAKRWTCIDQIPHRICKVAFEEFHTEFARGHCARAASEFWPLPRPDFADRNARARRKAHDATNRVRGGEQIILTSASTRPGVVPRDRNGARNGNDWICRRTSPAIATRLLRWRCNGRRRQYRRAFAPRGNGLQTFLRVRSHRLPKTIWPNIASSYGPKLNTPSPLGQDLHVGACPADLIPKQIVRNRPLI